MKYGLYYFKDTHNIGDDIWAYAQSLFYPHIDHLIDKTTVYKFKSDDDEEVATIIGAFVEPRNYEYCFFPPKNIVPLFVGAYFRSAMWELLENKSFIKYLKAYEPIGVRTTSAEFLDLGVEAYFSGCVSLTLPEMDKNVGKYICLVDVPEPIEKIIRDKVGNNYEIKVLTHELSQIGEEVYQEHRNLSIDKRFDMVKELLQIYADATLVITTKLQCALPCLTQHTPVLFTLPRNGEGIVDMFERMECFYDMFNMCWYDEMEDYLLEYDLFDPPQNPDTYMKYRCDLQKNIGMFISQCENGQIHSKEVYTESERMEIMSDILEHRVYQLNSIVDNKDDIIEEKNGVVLRLQQRLRKHETFNEWENIEFFADWSNRSRIMSEFINRKFTSLLDLGCGQMHIKKYLPDTIRYYGCDYKARDNDTIICDLSQGEFPDIKVDICFMAGVLEYLTNWKTVIEKMTSCCKQIIISYSTTEEAPVRDERWVNDLSERDLLEYVSANGFSLVEKKKVTLNSMGYSFMRKD